MLLLVASWVSVLDSTAAPDSRELFQQIATTHLNETKQHVQDPRVSPLYNFFTHHHCPDLDLNGFYFISNYLDAADQNHIDYRILPAISVQESSCGLHYPQGSYNLFGWDSGRKGFGSFSEAISFVAQQLASGYYYQGKSTEQQLRAYNPNPSYAPEVEKLMKEISNDP